MTYILYFIIGFAALQFLVACSNWLFQEKLSGNDYSRPNAPVNDVSLLIPARNEEKNIDKLLNDLITLEDYFREVIIFDDESTDRTAEIVRSYADRDNRIRLITSTGLPNDWLGKNFACHQLSLHAEGEYLLFLDADVRISKGLINKTINYLIKKKVDLLSIFPTQEMVTWQEKMTVPIMHYILLTLLPLPLVRLTRFSSLSAANGQCMLFSAKTYREMILHEKFRKSRAEDIEIARYLKSKGRKVSCMTGVEQISCRMYHNLPEAVNGFAKNVIYFFGNSYLLAVVFWIVTTLGIVPILIAGEIKMLILYCALVVFTRVVVSLAARQNIVHNLLLLIPQQGMLGVFIYQSILKKAKNQFQWKERTV